jgi:hypothetical protein
MFLSPVGHKVVYRLKTTALAFRLKAELQLLER